MMYKSQFKKNWPLWLSLWSRITYYVNENVILDAINRDLTSLQICIILIVNIFYGFYSFFYAVVFADQVFGDERRLADETPPPEWTRSTCPSGGQEKRRSPGRLPSSGAAATAAHSYSAAGFLRSSPSAGTSRTLWARTAPAPAGTARPAAASADGSRSCPAVPAWWGAWRSRRWCGRSDCGPALRCWCWSSWRWLPTVTSSGCCRTNPGPRWWRRTRRRRTVRRAESDYCPGSGAWGWSDPSAGHCWWPSVGSRPCAALSETSGRGKRAVRSGWWCCGTEWGAPGSSCWGSLFGGWPWWSCRSDAARRSCGRWWAARRAGRFWRRGAWAWARWSDRCSVPGNAEPSPAHRTPARKTPASPWFISCLNLHKHTDRDVWC